MSVDEKSSYYDAGDIETISIIKAKLTKEQFEGFCLGNAIKYNCRYNFKHDVLESKMRDIEKAIKYLSFLKETEKEAGKDDALKNMRCFSFNCKNKNFTAWLEESENKNK